MVFEYEKVKKSDGKLSKKSSMDHVDQVYVSPCQGSEFFFMPTQGVAILADRLPWAGYVSPRWG